MGDKKRVLVIARWPVGGIRTYFRYIYSLEAFNDYHFTFVMPDIDDVKGLLSNNLPVAKLSFVDSSEIGLLKAIYKTMRTQKFDVIHSHGYTAGLAASAFRFMFGTPHLLTLHEVLNEVQFKGGRGSLLKLVLSLLFKSVSKLMPVGQDAADNLLQLYPSTKPKVFPVRNGIPTQYFYDGTARDIKSEIGVVDSCFLIGFFGRFMEPKGFPYLVDAVEILSQDSSAVNFKVVCFGWGGFIREEQADIRNRGLEEHFIFMPQTNDMPSAIKGVDLVTMPSLWEACPLLPMEVLSAGVPIVGTSCVGSKEIFEGTPARVVEPRDAAALAEQIKQEMLNPTKQEFKHYAAVAVENFSNERSADGLRLLYESMFK
ncbi:hypothetical protein A3762_08275 [Oleiphilus sp. HI0125]|uniref:glycosyltransferase family 4 protein n=1 Tax=Oleiphilus sp. HI0125 TaxID=1822266 RepID=UPI0007C28FEE|nr:glycosyltransferase family 4 protein [Oleiphilus sp. HI0125]KZZ58212.1 hypothetical protein A3762_08275 [Oleiphilus sp. HI0125]